MLTPIDHVLVGAIALLIPLYDLLVWYPRLVNAPAGSRGRSRLRAYNEGMVQQWGLALATLVVWHTQARSWTDLGLGFSLSWQFALALALALGFMVFSLWQRAELAQESETEARDDLRAQLQHLRALLPHTAREWRRFQFLSVTAGICEELLYRGFLIWYLATMLPTGVALVIAGALFGMAHAYQGGRGMVQTGLVGLVMGVLYLLSGSLWIPMVLHAFIDLNSGGIAFALLSEEPDQAV